jgi:hypothetical protein
LVVTWARKGVKNVQNWFFVWRYRKFPQSHTQENIGATGTPVAADFAANMTQIHIFIMEKGCKQGKYFMDH